MALSASPFHSYDGVVLARCIVYTKQEEEDIAALLPQVLTVLESVVDREKKEIMGRIANLLWDRRNVDMIRTDQNEQPTTIGLAETIFKTRQRTPYVQYLIACIRDLVRGAHLPLTLRYENTVYGQPRPYAWRIENERSNRKEEAIYDVSCTKKEWREIKKIGSEALRELQHPQLKTLLPVLLGNRDGCLTQELRQLWDHVAEPAQQQTENINRLRRFFDTHRIPLRIVRVKAGTIRDGVKTGMNHRYMLRLTESLADTEEKT